MEKVNDFMSGFNMNKAAFYFDKNMSDNKEQYMEYAIKIAEKSQSNDKKGKFMGLTVPQPKIGAVLVTDKYVYCAARSGIKDGDHAEYTILNTVLNERNISETDVLYTTLEPCTPESRSDWSESCAELIINKRVKNVCVGTLDANPLVFGVGIDMLLNKNINVSFFDNKYREKLKEINKDFFDFCKKYPDMKLLKRINNFLNDSVDDDALKIYYGITKTSPEVYVKFYREMVDSGQIREGQVDGTLNISKDMALAFMKKPSYFIPGYNCGIINRIEDETKEAVYKDKREILDKSLLVLCNAQYKDNIFEKIYRIISRDNKSKNVTIKQLSKSFEQNLINILDLRECIINAFVHNNYSDNLGVTLLLDSKNELSVMNIISNNLNLEQCEMLEKSFNERLLHSIPFNPVLMHYFVQSGLAENTSLGMSKKNKIKFEIRKQMDNIILLTKIVK